MLKPSKALQLITLGTGGGRFATITQKRRTGGIRILYEKTNIHLDPGPGALVYSLEAGLDPQRLNGVLVSHCHPDHYNDAEVLIEAMTHGMTKKRGVLAAAHSVLGGGQQCDPSISKYHQQMPRQLVDARPSTSFDIGSLRFTATKARHTDPDAVGFRFETPNFGDVAYTSDSEYSDDLAAAYGGVRVLFLCVMRPAGNPWRGHMTSDDAVKIVKEAKPEMAILTHFGMKMIFKGPASEAKSIQEQTGIPTVAASDGMRISIDEEILVRAERKQRGLSDFVKG